MLKNVSEVIEEIGNEKSRNKKIELLQDYGKKVPGLIPVLCFTYDPRVKWTWDDVPPFREENVPEGMSYQTLNSSANHLLYFLESKPLSKGKKEMMLIQFLESLSAGDARLVKHIFKGKLPANGLTEKLVRDAFPGLLAEEGDEERVQSN